MQGEVVGENDNTERAECGCSELLLGKKSLLGKSLMLWVWREMQVCMY